MVARIYVWVGGGGRQVGLGMWMGEYMGGLVCMCGEERERMCVRGGLSRPVSRQTNNALPSNSSNMYIANPAESFQILLYTSIT